MSDVQPITDEQLDKCEWDAEHGQHISLDVRPLIARIRADEKRAGLRHGRLDLHYRPTGEIDLVLRESPTHEGDGRIIGTIFSREDAERIAELWNGRLWAALMAEHEAVGKAMTETEGDVWKLLEDAHAAVEVERKG